MSSDVDDKIASLGDWRGDLLARLRSIITAADPLIVEEVKWRKASNPPGGAHVVARGDRLHGRDLQGQGEADLHARCGAQRSARSL